jgi:hypothetical protein
VEGLTVTLREQIAHSLKIKFKLPRDRPTEHELSRILADIEQLRQQEQREPTEEEWRAITYKYVEFTGHNLYEGLDMSDLNTLFAQLRSTDISSDLQK